MSPVMGACGGQGACVPVNGPFASQPAVRESAMALYRFLFAPVLLALAVLLGARERAATAPPAAPSAPIAADAQRASPPGTAALVPGGARAAAPRSAAVP